MAALEGVGTYLLRPPGHRTGTTVAVGVMLGDVSAPDDTASEPVDLVVVGGGNMGAALLGGIVDATAAGSAVVGSIGVVELDEPRRAELAERFPGVAVTASIPPCRSAIVAVKPGGAPDVAAAVAGAGARRVLSIAAGVATAALDHAVGAPASGVAIIRAMPNTPALVGLGAAAICGGASADDDDLAWAEGLLRAVGTVDRLDESDLDAFTAVIGSGPAYLFLVAEALIDAAVDEGLAPDVAQRTVTRLLVGSARLLEREGDPATLRRNVTSPGGTTAAGLERLDAHDLRGAVRDAVAAATRRSRELG